MILRALHSAIGNFIQVLHLEDSSHTLDLLPTQVAIGTPLIQVCCLHGTGPDTRALLVTSLHPGGNRRPHLLVPTCLHLEGLSLWERRLHRCILGLKLGWC